jgi:ABC-2 type transport system ATP-binding protein
MSLQISNLTKVYGQQRAVSNISFEVEQGTIVGFLGPNGAGKSTTMKIATCYLPPTAGDVWVSGYNVVEKPLEAKKITGYLPEHNPLYLDMFVHEYLSFVGSLYNVPRARLKQRVGEMVERCGLAREQNKKIETLSKGYRQRVGLAQALIHDPQVLILDEPTSGLDPNQLVEIRKLIKDISQNKTVIFSTHIMQEVEALCDRVVLINRGEIVANDSLQHLLQRQGDQTTVIAEFENGISAEVLRHVKGVASVEVLDTFRFKVTAAAGADIRPELFRFAADNNLSLIGLKQEENSLEHIFQSLTSQTAVEHNQN